MADKKIIVTTGLPTCGKTTVSSFLGQEIGCEVLHTDSFRIGVFDTPLSMSGCQSALSYDFVFKKARQIILNGGSVVLDGTFRRRVVRQRAYGLAESAEVSAYVVEVVCSNIAVIRERLQMREREGRPLGITFEEYTWVKKTMEPLVDEAYPSGKGLLVPIIRYDSYLNEISIVSYGTRAGNDTDLGLIDIVSALEKWARLKAKEGDGSEGGNKESKILPPIRFSGVRMNNLGVEEVK
ncbi:MAG: ATP-binding protein [Planctomycetota bacterium]